jgi:hypothetical protein
MNTASKHSRLVVIAASLLALSLSALSPAIAAQSQTPQPVQSRSDEMLRMWSAIGNKLVVMAQDFPEDKYDFKVQKDERTFALNLLHAAALPNNTSHD